MTLADNPVDTSMIATRDLPELSLPGEAYYSQEWFERDYNRIFMRRWHYVGHVSQVATPGDFLNYEFGKFSVLVTRNRQGEINAMHNTCRHRGARLTKEASGNCGRAFVCPYHGWAFDHDGALRGAPRMHDGFDPSKYPLQKVHVDVWHGQIFINFSEETPKPLAETLTGADFSSYRLEDTKVAFEAKFIVKANWKNVWENGLECYHCAINHPEVSQVVQVIRDAPMPSHIPAGEFDWSVDYPVKYQSLTIDGQYQSKILLGDPDSPPTTTRFLSWHTSSFEMVANPDWTRVTTYKAIDATTTETRTLGFVHKDAVEGVDYSLEKLQELPLVTRLQDNELVEEIQQGVESPAYVPGPYNTRYEYVNQNFQRLYLEMLGL